MGISRNISALAAAGIIVVSLTGCSVVDAVIWGPEGARVIETTEKLIQAVAEGEQDAFACDEIAPDFGDSADWEGLSAGEPEQFNPDYWSAPADLDVAWSINLENGVTEIVEGLSYPGDVFYRETDDGLCVSEVVWTTVEYAS